MAVKTPTFKSTYNMPNGYRESDPWVSVIVEDENIISMHAERSGCTRPGYPDRAVYSLYHIERKLSGYYVYENGEFVPINKWYKEQDKCYA
jgi:hypothetical protein